MGKAATVSKNKYKKKAYDRVEFCVRKGKKDFYRECAAAEGKSLSKFLVDRIEKDLPMPEYLKDTDVPCEE